MLNHFTTNLRKRICYQLIVLACLLVPMTGASQSSSFDFGLAVNGSGSISPADFDLQIQGITNALNNPALIARDGSIGLTVVQYASGITQVHVPYTVISSEADVTNVINQLQGINQIQGSTNPGDGIATAMAELVANGDPSNFKYICLSTDGLPNSGQSIVTATNNAKAAGLERLSVVAIEDPPTYFEADFQATYGPIVFGGGTVTVVENAEQYAAILGTCCLTGTSCGATGEILYQRWTGNSGSTLADVPFNTAPDFEDLITEFRTPQNAGFLFGSRISGFLCPPETGYYTFWISGDDQAALYLSDNSDPALAEEIASVPAWTNPLQYDKYSSQMSDPVFLVGGKAYYIEGRHSEGGGQDHMSVQWQRPSGTIDAVIPGLYLSPTTGLTPIAMLREPDVVANPGNGLFFEYFEGDFTEIPDTEALRPACFGLTDKVKPGLGRSQIQYAERITGYYYAPEDGLYEFWLGSDDGSKMYFGDSLFLDNSGLHPYQEVSDTIGLEEGYHAITIEFFNRFGPDELSLFVREPGELRKEVPTASLFYDMDEVIFRTPENPVTEGNGIRYEVYHYSLSSDPVASGVQPDIDLSRALRQNEYRILFNGYVDIPQDGFYTFRTDADFQASLSIGDSLVVPLDRDLGCIPLEAGLHEITVLYDAAYSYLTELDIFWAGPGFAMQPLPASRLYYTGEIDERDPDIRPGLRYTYYQEAFNSAPTSLPDFETLTADKEGVVPNLTLSVRERENRYGIVFEGFIKVPEDNDYRFTLTCDDGAILYIGNTELINNDGRNYNLTTTRQINLAEGFHRIRVEYFQHYGGQLLDLDWSVPGQFSGNVPDSVLYYLVPEEEATMMFTLDEELRIDTETRIDTRSLKNQLSLYPNPASDMVYLQSQDINLAGAQVEIVSMDGRTRKSISAESIGTSSQELALPVYGLPDGLYMVKIATNDHEPVVMKLVIR